MVISTEQQALEDMFPHSETKTISFVINDFVNKGLLTELEIKTELKEAYPDVIDWSF